MGTNMNAAVEQFRDRTKKFLIAENICADVYIELDDPDDGIIYVYADELDFQEQHKLCDYFMEVAEEIAPELYFQVVKPGLIASAKTV